LHARVDSIITNSIWIALFRGIMASNWIKLSRVIYFHSVAFWCTWLH